MKRRMSASGSAVTVEPAEERSRRLVETRRLIVRWATRGRRARLRCVAASRSGSSVGAIPGMSLRMLPAPWGDEDRPPRTRTSEFARGSTRTGDRREDDGKGNQHLVPGNDPQVLAQAVGFLDRRPGDPRGWPLGTCAARPSADVGNAIGLACPLPCTYISTRRRPPRTRMIVLGSEMERASDCGGVAESNVAKVAVRRHVGRSSARARAGREPARPRRGGVRQGGSRPERR